MEVKCNGLKKCVYRDVCFILRLNNVDYTQVPFMLSHWKNEHNVSAITLFPPLTLHSPDSCQQDDTSGSVHCVRSGSVPLWRRSGGNEATRICQLRPLQIHLTQLNPLPGSLPVPTHLSVSSFLKHTSTVLKVLSKKNGFSFAHMYSNSHTFIYK